ncbi:hypothetical protein SVAN01_07323 [Stagonosporopsis vannaccii]|nr:hypothetical protein SVAN01_07323 [Stagonosporopsis vannaccii]
MQNYGQPPPVPPYQPQQQWNLQQQPPQQQQHATTGYNPGTYGAMPGGHTQGLQYPPAAQPSDPYAPQPHNDVPPPPPPKPYGFAAAVQSQNEHTQYTQNTQGWQQPPQSNQGHMSQPQQGGYPVYNNSAPPPSATPTGSYFPPPQGGRPGSLYGAEHVGNAASPVNPRPGSTVMSPNEQAPAYIPPSLSGQGVQAYMPSNTNPMPGVYVPPPPDVPAWQQAQHAPLQGGTKRFTYTKPTVDPSFYAQGYQGVQTMQQQPPPPLPPRFEQNGQQAHQPYGQQYSSQSQTPQQQQHQVPHPPPHFGQLGQPVQPLQHQQQQHTQLPVPQSYIEQQAAQLEQYAQSQQQQHMQSPAQSQSQWQAPAPIQNSYTHQPQNTSQPALAYQQHQQQHQQPQQPQQQWHPAHQEQQPVLGQAYHSVPESAMQAPKPLDYAETAPPAFVNQSSPQSHFVSPVVNQNASSFAPSHAAAARTDSVSSIALANLHSQRAATQTASPKPPSFVHPTPPPPRDDAAKFSALGTGGPSDWETFGASDEIDDEALFAKKAQPVQLDSVELPAHQPSSPSTQGWPSPTNPPITSYHDNRHDTYQPTPPTATVSPVHRTPSPRTPQQGFFVKDAVVATLHASPKPLQKYEAPQEATSGFVMGEVLWGASNPPKEIHNVSQQAQLEGRGTVSDDPQGVQTPVPTQVAPIHIPTSNVSASSVATPRQQRPGATRFFSDVGSTWGLSQKDGQQSDTLGAKNDSDLPAKLQAKDEELWRLRRESKDEMQRVQAEIEAGKADFLAKIERLKTDEEAARALADQQSLQLNQQIEAMKLAAEQAKIDADALKKENDLTIERIKEDSEGKEDTIKERDGTIVDLRKQLDELRTQLEEEKLKEVPQPPMPTAFDLIPDLDPWYASSLERYITMLRGEANEAKVEDKIKMFKAFMKAESAIRGIDFNDPAPVISTAGPPNFQNASGAAVESRHLDVTVPQTSEDDDDVEYSPGGRPRIKRPTMPLGEISSSHEPYVTSSQSTAILTPASSVQDDSTPIQSPPDEQAQSHYKAYVPPVMSMDLASSLPHRHAAGPSALPNVVSSIGTGNKHDEIFFGAHDSNSTKASHRPTDSSDPGGVPVVAPLNLAANRPVSITAPPKGSVLDTLTSLLPSQVQPMRPSPFIDNLRKEAATVQSQSKDVEELTKTWEKSASLTRRKNDDARRKRAEDNEAHNDDLFNSDEISYADLKDLEAEFKEEENKIKNQEAQDECKSYVQTVFDIVYHDLQADIAALTDLYIEAETLLQTSVSGVKSLDGGDAPTTKACLELLIDLHTQIEKTHEQVVQAVAERDKRYKKTEIQPLYNAGNIAKMKLVEKHFEQAEKQAIHRAKNEKAERLGDLVKVAEEAVVGAASIEQSERNRIVTAIRDLKEGDSSDDLLKRATETFDLLDEASKSLLTIFNRLEIDLTTAEFDADIARAHLDGAPESIAQDLQSKMKAKEAELKDEFTRRISVLDQDREEFDQLIKQKGGNAETSDEQEKEKRLKAALEEAKRRNGHA